MTGQTDKGKQLVFQNIEEALGELNAKDRGRYFLCECPECEVPEAFIYKNNVNFIQCNRESECGERMMLVYNARDEEKSYQSVYADEGYPSLSKEQIQGLSTLTDFVDYMRKNTVSHTLDEGYRGLGREATEPFVADLHDPKIVKRFFEYGKDLFPKDYSNSDWMCKRNLVFPIYGDDGLVERVLMRSSIEPDIEPKEIQLIVNPSKDARDFFIDIPKDAETVVIGEAILDAASFREIDKDIGLMALTGSGKSRGMSQFIVKNKKVLEGKKVVVAMDDDIAGWRATRNIVRALEEVNLDYQLFLNGNGINDSNEFLNKDKRTFSRYYNQVKSTFEGTQRNFIEVKEESEVIVICDNRMDAVAFRCLDSDVGVLAVSESENLKEMCMRLSRSDISKGKKIVLAFTNDYEGRKKEKEVQQVLDRFRVKSEVFPLPNNYKNVATYLDRDQKKFASLYESMKVSTGTKDTNVSRDAVRVKKRANDFERG